MRRFFYLGPLCLQTPKELYIEIQRESTCRNCLFFYPYHSLGKLNRRQTPVSILYKSIAGRYRPVRVADGPITARYRFIKNAGWADGCVLISPRKQTDISRIKC